MRCGVEEQTWSPILALKWHENDVALEPLRHARLQWQRSVAS